MRKIIAEINLRAIQDNAKTFKRETGVKLCAVVKANAYGHGAVEVVNALSGVADCFAVALLDEAIAVATSACGKDIFILTPPVTVEDVLLCASHGFIATVPDRVTARLIKSVCSRYGLTLRVHLKVNTGMNRYGMSLSELGKTCKFLQGCGQVRVEGIYSHIYDVAKAEEIRGRFASALTVYHRYFTGGIAHLSATAGALLGKDYAFDMVRIGLGLYGYLPSGTKPLALCKAMQVSATTVCCRAYRYGGAGYDKPQVPLKGERLYTCRYGYADGFLRRRKNGVVCADAQANNLCMDACVRVGKSARGERVVLLANADETAKRTDTIAYEVLCAATRRAQMEFRYDREKMQGDTKNEF